MQGQLFLAGVHLLGEFPIEHVALPLVLRHDISKLAHELSRMVGVQEIFIYGNEKVCDQG